MSKRILINATPAGEVWATFVENGTLEELFVESSRKQVMRGNIYRAHIESIDNKLRAAFINYGGDRNGFISVKDIHPDLFYRQPENERNFKLHDVLKEGQPLLVQLKKEEDGTKGAAFTTDIALASAYTVISPVSGGESTISRKITNNKTKKELKAILSQCDPDQRYGVMLRTASEGRESHEVLADLQNQLRAWGFIQADFQTKTAPGLLYRESQLITRMVRDHFTDDVDEIVLDDEEAYHDLKRYCEERLPNAVSKLKFYEERLPLFVRYKVESQINQLTSHQIDLPSGGNISINNTEAATVFDINSSRQSGGGDQQQMFLATNCEAAQLIARQVRLRGIGGLIFIDFINMREQKHQRQVLKVFKEAVKRDRAHLEIANFSRFCVLELSRNRIQERSLSTTHTNCPTCNGSGFIPSPNIVAFKLINSLYALAEQVGPGRTIKGKLPVAHAMYLLNDKRSVLVDLEERYGVSIEIEADFTQSLLAPDPFMEAGRSRKEGEASSSHRSKKNKRRERRERPSQSGRRLLRDTISKDKSTRHKNQKRNTLVADLTIDQADQENEDFTPPQIIGFIPKEQLDRAEAASLLSKAATLSPNKSGFEGRLARGEQVNQDAAPDQHSAEAGEERQPRKKRRRRKGRNRDKFQQQQQDQSPNQAQAQASNETNTEQASPEQITIPVESKRPKNKDERARRRAESRMRNRAKRLREGRHSHEANQASALAAEQTQNGQVEAVVSSLETGSSTTEQDTQTQVVEALNSKKRGPRDHDSNERRSRPRRGRRKPELESAESSADLNVDLNSSKTNVEVNEEATQEATESKSKPKKRVPRKKVSRTEVETAEAEATEEAPTPKKRPARKKVAKKEVEAVETETTEEAPVPKKRATRKKTTKKEVEAVEIEATEEAPAPKKRATRKKATKKEAEAVEIEATESTPAPKKRATRKKVTKKETTAVETEAIEEAPAPKKRTTRKKATKEEADIVETEATKEAPAPKKRTTRKKATKKEADIVETEATKEAPAPKKRATRKKATKKEAEAVETEATEEVPTPKKRATRKKVTAAKTSKKTSKKSEIDQARRAGAAAILDQLDEG